MRVVENVTLYKCDFCKKELKRKHAMESHELRCSRNPLNDRPCLNCPHLDRKEIEFDTGISTYHGSEPIYRKANAFYCKAKDILLLHPKTQYLEGRNSLNWVLVDGEEVQQFDMPTTCDVYEKERNNNELLLESLKGIMW